MGKLSPIRFTQFVNQWNNFNVSVLLLITAIHYFVFNTKKKISKNKTLGEAIENNEGNSAEEIELFSTNNSTGIRLQPNQKRALNTYDLLKAVGVLVVLIDHLGWIYVVRDPYWNRICRCIGRCGAPIFFYIAGANRSYRFRITIWLWTLYTLLTSGLFKLGLEESSWCSMATILFSNFILYSCPVELLAKYPFLNVPILVFGYLYDDAFNNTFHIPYGCVALTLPICAYLVVKTKYTGKIMTFLIMIYHTWDAFSFCQSYLHYAIVSTVCSASTYSFMFFEMKDLPWLPEPIEWFIFTLSNNACIIFHFHLALFRLIYRS